MRISPTIKQVILFHYLILEYVYKVICEIWRDLVEFKKEICALTLYFLL